MRHGRGPGGAVRSPIVVGRDDEIRSLLGMAGDAARGLGRVVVIEGEAGAGKTRLVQEVLRILADSSGGRVEPMAQELNGIMAWVEQLNKVDVAGVAPMTSVVAHSLRMREDNVTDGGGADALMANAPGGEDNFFVVPKVVE